MIDDLEELILWEGQTVRTVIEIINNRLRQYNLHFVETMNPVDGKVTFVIGHPTGPYR